MKSQPTFLQLLCSLLHHQPQLIIQMGQFLETPSHSLVYSAAIPLSEHCVPQSFSLFWRVVVPEGDLAAKMRLCSIARGKELESPGGI